MTTRIESIRTAVESLITEAGFDNYIVFKYSDDTTWGTNLFNITTKEGLLLTVADVYRHNATDSDVSVRVYIDSWKEKAGRTIYSGKPMNSTWSEKRIRNEVAKAIEAYKI